jgi:squalene-associated FAD-dependent desaturase
MTTIHIIGAGLSGLAAGLLLVEAGHTPIIHEAGPQAGGRCRSYFDAVLNTRIDNGNHLLLSGNRNAMRYLDLVGARHTMIGPAEPMFPYVDLSTGERWTLRPNRGKLPWWLFHSDRRVPGTKVMDYLEPIKLAWAGTDKTVGQVLDSSSVLYHRLWESLAVSALNVPAMEGSARLFWAIVRQTLGAGGEACLPLVPEQGLSESFIDPAIAYIEKRGGKVTLQRRLSRLQFSGEAICALEFGGETEMIDPSTPVVLAVPAPVAANLVPGVAAPEAHSSILNLHFAVGTPKQGPGFIGVVGGTAEWIFQKGSILSVTVSAADRLIDRPAEDLAVEVWSDLRRIYTLPEALPKWRVVKEKRATFAATPAQARVRPGCRTRWQNLFLAGDWTDTGLPGTIEGSIQSGFAAARQILKEG